jgi:hypothetical protein
MLTPLVGVDPSTVTVLQGPDVTQATAAMHADAVAVGAETVLVGPTFTGTTPQDVALLAHELTHVARARDPRFVPPIARPASPRGAGHHSEEDIARRVEARVTSAVNARWSPAATAPAPHAESRQSSPFRAAAEPFAPEPLAFESAENDPHRLPEQTAATEWGGLPAPWEPLPEWLAPSPSTPRESVVAPFVSTGAPVVMGPAAMVSSPAGAPPATVVHAADESRMGEGPSAAAPTAPAPAGDEASEGPDIDWLARQVYSALKRRLGTEARREDLL